MSFEAGGRTDKAGNRFEIRYFILQILRIIEEDIRSVTLEALGDDEKGTDIFVSLVSPISFIAFEDLTKRAKNTSDNPRDFYENQVKKSDDKMIKCYSNYCKRINKHEIYNSK